MCEWHSMPNVIRLCLCPIRIFVDQNDLASDAVHYERIASGCADKSTAYNSNFHHVFPFAGDVFNF
jgi:hypothetical protein